MLSAMQPPTRIAAHPQVCWRQVVCDAPVAMAASLLFELCVRCRMSCIALQDWHICWQAPEHNATAALPCAVHRTSSEQAGNGFPHTATDCSPYLAAGLAS
jgi:hypothetical protein